MGLETSFIPRRASDQCTDRVWISSDNVKAVAEKGYKLVHAASDFFYLDCGGGGWLGEFTDGNSWCDPFKTWQKVNMRATPAIVYSHPLLVIFL